MLGSSPRRLTKTGTGYFAGTCRSAPKFVGTTSPSKVACPGVLQEVAEEANMKIRANFAKDGKWWAAWTEDVPGALTQGETQEEARENVVDAVRMMQEPVDLPNSS